MKKNLMRKIERKIERKKIKYKNLKNKKGNVKKLKNFFI